MDEIKVGENLLIFAIVTRDVKYKILDNKNFIMFYDIKKFSELKQEYAKSNIRKTLQIKNKLVKIS